MNMYFRIRARLRQDRQSQPGVRATWQLAVFLAFAVTTPTLKTSAADDVIQYVAPQQVCIIDCDKITESSGLAASQLLPDVFWTHNDSGDKPRLYAFDETGKHLGTCDVEGAKAKDWEDMASFNLDGNACLLVGDVGDNRGKRETCELYLMEEVAPDEEKLVVRQTVRYSYDRGPQDCESIGFDTTTRQVLFVSKNWTRTAQVFVLEWPAETDEVQTARFIGEINVPGLSDDVPLLAKSERAELDALPFDDDAFRSDSGLVASDTLRTIDGEVAQLLAEAVKEAEEAPAPAPGELFTDVYVRY